MCMSELVRPGCVDVSEASYECVNRMLVVKQTQLCVYVSCTVDSNEID